MSAAEQELLDQAREMVEEKASGSQIFDNEADKKIPRFDFVELFIGDQLGKGGFCSVNEITKIILNKEITHIPLQMIDDDDDALLQDRKFISTRYLRNGKDARYAIKKLREDISVDDTDRFVGGIMDLAIEARFLSVLRHPSIIKMRAVANASPYSTNYYIILDRLYETLTQKIPIWKARKIKLTGVAKLFDRKGKKKKGFFIDRLMVSYDLCSALKYLHSLSIIYRDLKPDNIGFDVRGDVKIFDFGLSREVDSSCQLENNLYTLSGNTGSLRYMAPEVAKGEPYNHTVDVYSFGILLWQICSLETPFTGFDKLKHNKNVVWGGERPKIKDNLVPNLQSLISYCWSDKIEERPEFEEIADSLRSEITASRRDDNYNTLDVSSRTFDSLHD